MVRVVISCPKINFSRVRKASKEPIAGGSYWDDLIDNNSGKVKKALEEAKTVCAVARDRFRMTIEGTPVFSEEGIEMFFKGSPVLDTFVHQKKVFEKAGWENVQADGTMVVILSCNMTEVHRISHCLQQEVDSINWKLLGVDGDRWTRTELTFGANEEAFIKVVKTDHDMVDDLVCKAEIV